MTDQSRLDSDPEEVRSIGPQAAYAFDHTQETPKERDSGTTT
jgi:hypothetical protein